MRTEAPLCSEKEVAQIEARAHAASAGPWRKGWTADGGRWCVLGADPDAPRVASTTPGEQGEADADFILHARRDIPRLIEAFRGALAYEDSVRQFIRSKRLEGELQQWQEQRAIERRRAGQAPAGPAGA